MYFTVMCINLFNVPSKLYLLIKSILPLNTNEMSRMFVVRSLISDSNSTFSEQSDANRRRDTTLLTARVIFGSVSTGWPPELFSINTFTSETACSAMYCSSRGRPMPRSRRTCRVKRLSNRIEQIMYCPQASDLYRYRLYKTYD